MPDNISPTLSTRITAELRNRRMTVMDFLRELEIKFGKKFKIPGYNHLLRVCKGETYPGPNLLPVLCDFLAIDVTEARRMVLIDKGIHSGATEAFTGKDKQLLRFEEIWRQLSKNQKDELLMIAKVKLEMKV